MSFLADLAKGGLIGMLKYCMELLGREPTDDEKIKAIQHILGTTEDGDPGPATYRELNRLMPPKAERA